MYYLSIFFNQEQEADPPKEDSIRYSVIPYISNITLLHNAHYHDGLFCPLSARELKIWLRKAFIFDKCML